MGDLNIARDFVESYLTRDLESSGDLKSINVIGLDLLWRQFLKLNQDLDSNDFYNLVGPRNVIRIFSAEELLGDPEMGAWKGWGLNENVPRKKP